MSDEKLLQRKDAPVESTWNREAVYPTWDAWDADLQAAQSELPELAKFSGRLNEGPDMILAWLDEYARQFTRVWKLYQYTNRSVDVDSSEMEAKSRFGQAKGLFGQFLGASAFADSEMLAIGDQLLEWADANPDLRLYRQYFDNLLRLRPHQRSPEVEKLLKSLEFLFESPREVHAELTDTDMRFADSLDSQGNQPFPQPE